MKKRRPPRSQSVSPAAPPAMALLSLVIKKRTTTNRIVRSRVVRIPGNALWTYDSDGSAFSVGNDDASGFCSVTFDDIESLHIYTSKRQGLPSAHTVAGMVCIAILHPTRSFLTGRQTR